MLNASAESIRNEAATNDAHYVANSTKIREYLNAGLATQTLREQDNNMNVALADCTPPSMPRMMVKVPIAFHDEILYGKQPCLRDIACFFQAKKGTNHFNRIANAYVICMQVRLTLALINVLLDENVLNILKILRRLIQELSISDIRVLYLDKIVALGEINEHLKEFKQTTITACPLRCKQGGTSAFYQGRKSYRTECTSADTLSTNLAHRETLVPSKSGKRYRKWLAPIVIELDWPPEKIHPQYRRRFGIEYRYRIARHVLAMSTSCNAVVRFFLLIVDMALLFPLEFLYGKFVHFLSPCFRRVDGACLRFRYFTRMPPLRPMISNM